MLRKPSMTETMRPIGPGRPRGNKNHLPGKIIGLNRTNDRALGWVEREHPQLAAWRTHAVEWIRGETLNVKGKLYSLSIFLGRYIALQGLPLDPAVFLARSTVLPDFFQTACANSHAGAMNTNHIHNFLNFVLLREFSTPTDNGQPVISPGYHNPISLRTKNLGPKLDESVRSPLPYAYIDELRQLLVAGPNFCDWRWAQGALGTTFEGKGLAAPDWFQVTEADIDRADPDCVWRLRTRMQKKPILEMWSPVRWVGLLTKLLLPLRTHQVRMLDSGEADTWRFQASNWILNTHRLAQGTERRPLQQGVFRRTEPLSASESVSTLLYINTNKTADTFKSGPEKGYIVPWPHSELLYWLEKLRDWQQKFNPISRRTSWTELDGRHIEGKSEVQLASYQDACFLFRTPEAREGERHLPVTDQQMQKSWFNLLEALEKKLATRGETHLNGSPIRFLPPPEKQNQRTTTLFPLHSLRVSLVTALALEGRVPFTVLQKLVGHSRLLMTLYYTKPGAKYIRDVLLNAVERLDANKEASLQNFLLDTEHDELLKHAICNSAAGISVAIPQHPSARNPAGWMPMHHGLCVVGGNTSEVEGNSSVGGCHNGGANIGSNTIPKHGPVPGGSRNCVRCRWFVTEPYHLPSLAAHFNTLAYHFDEARNACLDHENILQKLKRQKADAEEAGQPFAQLNAYRQQERIWESAMKKFSDLAEDVVACYRLMERCQKALASTQGGGTKLIATGNAADLHIAFEETESELLQLAGVCQSAEAYPDLEPGKAVFRRSQLLDAVLFRDNLPPVFMLLSEQEQLLAGNAFINRLAQQMNPSNPVLGQREAIRLMDAGVSLSNHFGIDLTALVPAMKQVSSADVASIQLRELAP